MPPVFQHDLAKQLQANRKRGCRILIQVSPAAYPVDNLEYIDMVTYSYLQWFITKPSTLRIFEMF